MLFRRLHNLPLLCLLVLCLLIGPASAFGYVWCVSADGHATLEAALGGDCGTDFPTPPAGDLMGLTLAADDDDCGPCLDISSAPRWGSARDRHSGAPASLPAQLAPASVTACLTLPDRQLNRLAVDDPPPRTPEPILHHRTIVLLI